MRKNLTAIGGSLGFIIDKPFAELYQLDRNTIIEITPKEDGLNIRFVKECLNRAEDGEVIKAATSINTRKVGYSSNISCVLFQRFRPFDPFPRHVLVVNLLVLLI